MLHLKRVWEVPVPVHDLQSPRCSRRVLDQSCDAPQVRNATTDAMAGDANTSTHDDVASGTAAGVEAVIADAEAQGASSDLRALTEQRLCMARETGGCRWCQTPVRWQDACESASVKHGVMLSAWPCSSLGSCSLLDWWLLLRRNEQRSRQTPRTHC